MLALEPETCDNVNLMVVGRLAAITRAFQAPLALKESFNLDAKFPEKQGPLR